MVGIDGRPMSDEERKYRHLRDVITGCTRLMFSAPSSVPNFFSVQGVAAALLAADLAPRVSQESKIEVVLTACARPFMDSLHSERYFTEIASKNAEGRPWRFDSSWLRFPSPLAWSLGAVRFINCVDYAGKAVALVLGAEKANRALGANLPLHPALAAIEAAGGADWPSLIDETAHQHVATFGTTMLAPNASRDGFQILYWYEDFHTAKNLRVFSPGTVIKAVAAEMVREQGEMLYGKETRENARRWLPTLSSARPLSTSAFVDIVLPLQYQVALAYEGLFHSHTGQSRTANLPVTFAGTKEHVFESAWGELFNSLSVRAGFGQQSLPAQAHSALEARTSTPAIRE